MRKNLIDLVIEIFLIGVGIGMIIMVTGFFTSNSDMVGCGIDIYLISLVLPLALPMVLDVIENYLE